MPLDMKKRKPSGHSKPTKIKAADDSDSLEDHIVELAMNGKLAEASEKAIRRQQKLGMAITYKEGK